MNLESESIWSIVWFWALRSKYISLNLITYSLTFLQFARVRFRYLVYILAYVASPFSLNSVYKISIASLILI